MVGFLSWSKSTEPSPLTLSLRSFTIYDWCVTYYGDIAHLANSPWSFAIDPAMTGMVMKPKSERATDDPARRHRGVGRPNVLRIPGVCGRQACHGNAHRHLRLQRHPAWLCANIRSAGRGICALTRPLEHWQLRAEPPVRSFTCRRSPNSSRGLTEYIY